MLFISGTADEIVPHSNTKELHDHATASAYKEFYSIIGGGHQGLYVKDKDFFGVVADFLQKAAEIRK